VNVATVHPPAGAGNVVFVFVPGDTEISGLAGPGALTITIPEPPEPPLSFPAGPPPAPPPPPVLTVPAVPGEPAGPPPPVPPVP
jgi:hypothetical protein